MRLLERGKGYREARLTLVRDYRKTTFRRSISSHSSRTTTFQNSVTHQLSRSSVIPLTVFQSFRSKFSYRQVSSCIKPAITRHFHSSRIPSHVPRPRSLRASIIIHQSNGKRAEEEKFSLLDPRSPLPNNNNNRKSRMPPPPDGLINQGKEKLDISRISELVCGCS